MAQSGTDLLAFDNSQVYHGLNFIFSTACSDYFHSFARLDAPIALKVSAVLAIKRLYKDCFEPRCAPVLAHTSERGGNPLNSIAYMLWDVAPIIYHARDDDRLFLAIAEVLKDALNSSNAACIESALHGLGHAQSYYPDTVEIIIDRFLAGIIDEREAYKFEGKRSSLRPLRPELLKYAREAREGTVQYLYPASSTPTTDWFDQRDLCPKSDPFRKTVCSEDTFAAPANVGPNEFRTRTGNANERLQFRRRRVAI